MSLDVYLLGVDFCFVMAPHGFASFGFFFSFFSFVCLFVFPSPVVALCERVLLLLFSVRVFCCCSSFLLPFYLKSFQRIDILLLLLLLCVSLCFLFWFCLGFFWFLVFICFFVSVCLLLLFRWLVGCFLLLFFGVRTACIFRVFFVVFFFLAVD